MDKKTSPGSIGGKGFIVVLVLCAAVLGASAWILLSDVGIEQETAEVRTVDISEAVVTMIPRQTAAPVVITAAPAEQPVVEEDTIEEEPDEAVAVFSEAMDGYVWPVRGEIEAPYSVETLRYDATMADWRTHDGIDIAAAVGTEVIASAGGTVVSVRQDDMYGTTVELDHQNGVHTIYSNLASEPPVSEGQTVTMGQTIGSVGKTALAEVNEVPHLHFAMTLDGRSADPMAYLDTDYITEE